MQKETHETSPAPNHALQHPVHVKDDKFLTNRSKAEDKTRQKTKRTEKAMTVAEFDYDMSKYRPPFEQRPSKQAKNDVHFSSPPGAQHTITINIVNQNNYFVSEQPTDV